MINKLLNLRIVNFMVVGGIGYVVNMGIYWPLSLVFKSKVLFLGQEFYLPPFVISSLVAIVCNYELNKIITFRKQVENKLGGLRYLSMAIATLFIDMLFLFILVQYFHLYPVAGAALAILIVFVIRYFIAKRWVWSMKAKKVAKGT